MTEQDHKIKEMIESGMSQDAIRKSLGISLYAVRNSLGFYKAKKPLPKDKCDYMKRGGFPMGSNGNEVNTLADFEVKALMSLVHERKAESVAAALMDFWLEHGDV